MLPIGYSLVLFMVFCHVIQFGEASFKLTQPSAKISTPVNFVALKHDKEIPVGIVALQESSTSKLSPMQASIRSLAPILASAFCVAAIMYPLDLIRALQMANAGAKLTTKELLVNFKNAHGITGFFTQGLAPELARSTWMRFIKFGLFPIMHLSISGLSETNGTPLTKALAAILTSIPEAVSIMPLEIAKIALQSDTRNVYKNSMFAAMGDLYRKAGWSVFTVGYSGVQYKQAAWSVAYFLSINFFDKYTTLAIQKLDSSGSFRAKNPKAAKLLTVLIAGFLAGVFGAFFNTPGDTIRSTIQKRVLSQVTESTVGGTAAGELCTSFFGVGREIVASKGIGGLYAGFKFKSMHLGGGGALMAFLVPFFKNLFEGTAPEAHSTKQQ